MITDPHPGSLNKAFAFSGLPCCEKRPWFAKDLSTLPYSLTRKRVVSTASHYFATKLEHGLHT